MDAASGGREPGSVPLDVSELERPSPQADSAQAAARPEAPDTPLAGQDWEDDSSSGHTPWSWSTSAPATEELGDTAASVATDTSGTHSSPRGWAALRARAKALPPAARWSAWAAAAVLLGVSVTLASLDEPTSRKNAASASTAAPAAGPPETAKLPSEAAAPAPAEPKPTTDEAPAQPPGDESDPARALEEDMAAMEAELGEEETMDFDEGLPAEEEPAGDADEAANAEATETKAEENEPIPQNRARRIAIARSLVERGQRMRRHKRLGMAESYYLRALRHFDHYPRAVSGLVKVHLARGDAREALRWAKRLVAMKPNRRSHRYLLGEAYAMNGNMRKARRHWLRAARWGLKVAAKRLEETSR